MFPACPTLPPPSASSASSARSAGRARLGRALAGLAAALLPALAAAETVTVFAAASLTQALDEVARGFEAASGHTVRTSYAASSTLAKQVEAGAPAALFLSADTAWMAHLAQRGLIDPASRVDLLGNRLVLVVPGAPTEGAAAAAALKPGFDLAGLLGRDGRLATGDPAHVPAGRYAQQALTQLGLWTLAEPRLVRADSVRAALAFVERGEVPAGIVYATDVAASRRVAVRGVFPAASHPPITYPLARLKGAGDRPAARALHDWLRGPQAAAVFRQHGFSVLAAP